MIRSAKFKLAALVIIVLASIAVMVFWAFGSPAYTVNVQNWESTPSANVQLPQLPDVGRYNKVTVEGMMPKTARNVVVGVGEMKDYQRFLPTHIENQDTLNAKVIVLSQGIASIDDVYKGVNNPNYISKYSTGYLIKVPLFVDAGATLVSNGALQAMTLKQESGVFIAVRGSFFAVNSAIIGWNFELNKPANFESREVFRPYLVFWDGSKSYIAGTRLAHLGYDAAQAYGLSYSTHDHGVVKTPEVEGPDLEWPTGWIVDSVVEDLYAGLYSHKSENIAMIGNVFKDNIMHGIAAHDHSRNLLIAQNEISGTKNKYGIFATRNVENSWIFKNKIYDHADAGIEIERNSQNNVIAFNEIYNNQDGVRVYESDHTLFWSNIIRDNTRNGVRVRNSADVTFRHETIMNNGLYGLDAYTGRLADHESRDLTLDPYAEITRVDLAYCDLTGNKGGQLRFDHIDLAHVAYLKSSDDVYSFMEGDLKPESARLYELITNSDSVVIIKSRDELARERKANR